MQRLDAETLRDALLAVSGKLLPVDSGPPVWPELPEEIKTGPAQVSGEDRPTAGLVHAPEEQTYVRSLFLIQKRTMAVPFLEVFDLPDFITSCARRNTTTVAPQALSLLNGPLATEMARAFAARVAREAGLENRGPHRAGVWLALSPGTRGRRAGAVRRAARAAYRGASRRRSSVARAERRWSTSAARC